MRKIPGTGATEVTTPEDFERYARWIADDATVRPELALDLLVLAAASVLRATGYPVIVWTHDARPAYIGYVRKGHAWDETYAVANPETGETVRVPRGSVTPLGARIECDCHHCGTCWEAMEAAGLA